MIELLDYERIDSRRLVEAIRVRPGEQLLVLQPFGWHIDGKHIPNAAEQFSRESVCRDHRWQVVCEFGPYVAIVQQVDAAGGARPVTWHPIESYDKATCPLDVLVATEHGVGEARQWDDGDHGAWYWANTDPSGGPGPGQIFPKFWMPLPPPPQTDGAEKE